MLKKTLATVSVAVAITSCASKDRIGKEQSTNEESLVSYENRVSGIDSIMTKAALDWYREQYVLAEYYKAFAQSASGAWAARTARTSTDHAKTNALVACQTRNKAHEAAYPCKIINVNGEWVGR